tara:strand:+ start:347 stop:769 length:423 start_codon:yes stop_codon:yes gene_type:complete
MKSLKQVDHSKVSTPVAEMTKTAYDQLCLIKKSDFTIHEKELRIAIKGKECDGFTYEVFFDEKKPNDIKVGYFNEKFGDEKITLLMDPFSAFYLSSFRVEYLFNPAEDIDGFVVINKNQEKQQGKFWVKKSGETPPMIKA